MTYVIAEPCIGVKDTSCVDACPVDCIHPKKNTTYNDGRPGFDEVPSSILIPWNASLACRSVRSPRFLRWMTFPKSGSTTRNLMQATSKAENHVGRIHQVLGEVGATGRIKSHEIR